MLFESRIVSLVCLCPDLFFTTGPSHPGGKRHQRWRPWNPFSSCLWSLFLSQLRVAFAVSFPTYEARAKAARWVLWPWGGWHFPREVGGSENDSPGGTSDLRLSQAPFGTSLQKWTYFANQREKYQVSLHERLWRTYPGERTLLQNKAPPPTMPCPSPPLLRHQGSPSPAGSPHTGGQGCLASSEVSTGLSRATTSKIAFSSHQQANQSFKNSD